MTSRRLGTHFEHAARALTLLGAVLVATTAVAQPVENPYGPPTSQAPGRLRAAAADAAWIGGTAVLDLTASEWTFARCPTCYEGNPTMRGGLPARAGVKLAMTGIGVVWADHLRRKGDRRGARIVRWTLVGLQVGFAGWSASRGR